MSKVRVTFPKSDFVHDFILHPGGRVTRTTVGVGVETDCGVFPELQSRDDLVAKLEAQGYEVSEKEGA